MKTVRCPECNLVNWATAADCKRCRFVFQNAEVVAVETASMNAFQKMSNQTAAQSFANTNFQHDFAFRESAFQSRQDRSNYQQRSNNYEPNNYYQANYQSQNLKSGLAIASMVLGIFAFVTALFIIGILFAPVGLILGIVALVKANKKPNEYGGKGFAIAGLVTSGMVLLIVPIILAIAIPNLMAARRAANEGSALSVMRTISKAQGNSRFNGQQLKCSTLQDMAKSQIISEDLADGIHHGYRFVISDLPVGGCEITATPISTTHGNRSFYYTTTDGQIRGANKQGKVANQNDPRFEY